jgi:hypothetical protein
MVTDSACGFARGFCQPADRRRVETRISDGVHPTDPPGITHLDLFPALAHGGVVKTDRVFAVGRFRLTGSSRTGPAKPYNRRRRASPARRGSGIGGVVETSQDGSEDPLSDDPGGCRRSGR